MILVTGATGMFGSRVTRALVDLGVQPLAMTRSKSRFEQLEQMGARPVAADFEDIESLDRMLSGVTKVFLVSPMHHNLLERELNLVEAAQRAGVQHIVKLYGCVDHGDDPLNQMHNAVIEALKTSGLNWTLVSPNTVMESNFFPQAEGLKTESCFYASAADGKIGMVSAEDTARVSALVLTTDGHEGKNYEITGPEAITFAQAAEQFSRALGRAITYVDVPEAEMLSLLLAEGMPAEAAELEILCHFRLFRQGKADLVTDTYQRLMGTEATSVERFVLENKTVFSP